MTKDNSLTLTADFRVIAKNKDGKVITEQSIEGVGGATVDNLRDLVLRYGVHEIEIVIEGAETQSDGEVQMKVVVE